MKHWKRAQSLADLGELTAQWLESRITTHPGCVDDAGPDEETKHLVPLLATINRGGYVTTCSQPGHSPERHRGSVYEQRAAVQGYIADGPLLRRIRSAASQAGITVIAHRAGSKPRPGEPVTTVDGDPVTWFGVWMPHRIGVRHEWRGIGGRAARELRTATQLTLIDPKWGRDDHLWPMLRRCVA